MHAPVSHKESAIDVKDNNFFSHYSFLYHLRHYRAPNIWLDAELEAV